VPRPGKERTLHSKTPLPFLSAAAHLKPLWLSAMATRAGSSWIPWETQDRSFEYFLFFAKKPAAMAKKIKEEINHLDNNAEIE